MLHHLLQLLLRVSRDLQLVVASLSSRGGVPALVLRAFQSQLLHTWRPQASRSHEDNNNPAAEANALAVSVGALCKALAAKVDSCWLLKELLRPPLVVGCIPGAPSGAPAFLQERQQISGVSEAEGGPRDGRGVGGPPKEEGMRKELGSWRGPPRLDILRLKTLELIAMLRQLILHLPSASAGLSSESAPNPGVAAQHAGLSPQREGPPMRVLLEAAAWLLSSEAVGTLMEAASWLFGPLVSHLSVHPTCCREMKEEMELDAYTAASALQAAAVRAFAAGGGTPSDDELLLARNTPGVGGWVHSL